MAPSRVDIIDRSSEKAHIWVNDMAAELGTADRQAAYRTLRAFLHVLRDHLSVDEAAQLAAQLPLLARGIFDENWDPSATPQRYRDPAEFLERVATGALLWRSTVTSSRASMPTCMTYLLRDQHPGRKQTASTPCRGTD
jgi:uncharacterized protein (DUF2267 family)